MKPRKNFVRVRERPGMFIKREIELAFVEGDGPSKYPLRAGA